MISRTTLGRTGLNVSRIGLGTTEIGFVYGIGKRSVPNRSDAIKLLKEAVHLGITFIDTARFYGKAEEYIGASGILKTEGVVVLTKCGHVLDRAANVSIKDLKVGLMDELDESRRNLRLDILPLVLFHGASKKLIDDGTLPEIIAYCKDKEVVRFMGASTRGEETPLAAIESGAFDALELGYSILDQRMATRVIPAAAEKSIGIINRSVLLKGALTKAAEKLPDTLQLLKDNGARARQIAEEMGEDLPTLAIRFALSHPQMHVSLIGTNKLSHLNAAARAAKSGILSADIIEKLRALAVEDVRQVDPAHWPPEAVSDSKEGKKIIPHFHSALDKAPK
jgi:aryl-alcohol dehydrogenase-like predicted oxidoreductase